MTTATAKDKALDEALCDVRKAYRLVWLYQRRVLDIAKVVADEFDGHEFRWWSPAWFDPPGQRTKDLTTKWAPDLIPAYHFSLLYLPGDATPKPKPGDWMLEINFKADSGYLELESEEGDPTKFEAPERCTSTMGLYAWACTSSKVSDWYWSVWNVLEWPDDVFKEYKKEGIKVVGQTTSLATIPTKDAIVRDVDTFKALCRKKLGSAFQIA